MSYIQRGSKNKWVEYLQMSLVSLGYSIGPYGIDGNFGGGTEEAVYEFQADNNLQEDGKVGNDTWNAIKDHIIPIQEKLIEKGYNVGSCGADGIYGYSTVEAVKNFQRDNGLTVDGIAGPDTQDVLFNSSNKFNASLFAINCLLTKNKPNPNPTLNPALLKIAGNLFMKQLEEKRENEFDINKIDLAKFVVQKLQRDEFLKICNRITSNVFNFLKLDVKITSLDYTYSWQVGFLKVTLNAKSGGDFTFGGDKYIFKNSSLNKTEGFLLNTLDFITDKINTIFVPQIKTQIETFKQKVGEAIVNGSVTIKFEFPKLIYVFEIAKKDDLSKLYGTFTITLELNFDLSKIAERVGQQVLNSLGILKGLIITIAQMIAIIIIVAGILFIVQDPFIVESILTKFI